MEQDYSVTTNKEKGYLFETYIVKRLCGEYCSLLEWRSDKEVDAWIYPKSNKYPDTVFRVFRNGLFMTFAVECKWRSGFRNLNSNKGECDSQVGAYFDEQQLTNYKNYGEFRNMPVLMALGVGGTPDSPEQLYLIPVHVLKLNLGTVKYIEKYKVQDSECIIDFFFNLLACKRYQEESVI